MNEILGILSPPDRAADQDLSRHRVGIKDSSGDWNNTKSVLDAFPGFGTFAGSETGLLATLRGGGGCITTTGNINPAGIRARPLARSTMERPCSAAARWSTGILATAAAKPGRGSVQIALADANNARIEGDRSVIRIQGEGLPPQAARRNQIAAPGRRCPIDDRLLGRHRQV